MEKAELSKILGHQLKGVMLHSDICKVYLLKGNKRCATFHYKQMMCESRNFMLTNQHIIEKYNMIVEPVREAPIAVQHNATDEQLNEMWQKWEAETLAIYHHALMEEPTCSWWKKMVLATSKEIKNLTTF